MKVLQPEQIIVLTFEVNVVAAVLGWHYLDSGALYRLAALAAQAAEASRILTGLIQSVEKETGVLARAAAQITSAFILFLGSACLRSSVYSLRSPV